MTTATMAPTSTAAKIQAAYDQIEALGDSLNNLWFDAFQAAVTDEFLGFYVPPGEETALWDELRGLESYQSYEATAIMEKVAQWQEAELADRHCIHPEMARVLTLLKSWIEAPRYSDPGLADATA